MVVVNFLKKHKRFKILSKSISRRTIRRFNNNIIMNIYKTVFDTEQQGKDVLIQKDVWQEVTEEGVTSMQYINGTKAVVNIGKVIDPAKTTDPENPVYYPGWAYDIMSTDD